MDADFITITTSIALGIGLAAAAGFRIFVPFLCLSIAAKLDLLELSSGFEFLEAWPTIIILSVATALEIGAYFVPWIDNLLDLIATPAALIAGTLLTASVLGEVDPVVQWAIAIIAGGGTAGTVQGLTVLARGASLASTGGLGNPAVSTAETGGSILTAILAILVPLIALLLVLAFIFLASSVAIKRWRGRSKA